MIQGRGSEQAPVACIPRVAVESGRRGVAGQTSIRRWPRTTRCNGRAVIVMRGGEPVGRWPLIAPFQPYSVACGMGNRPEGCAVGAISSVSSEWLKVDSRRPKRRGLIEASSSVRGS